MTDVVIHSRQVEMIPLAALKGYERNARIHPNTQVDSIVAIIRDAGFTNPLLIDDDDVIIAGHGRALAAKKLKMAEVPCVRVSGLTEEQVKALRISDNRTALGATWDDALLKVELADLQAMGFDLSLTGFTGLELQSIFSTQDGLTDPDEVPETPAIPVSKLGDVWRLGEHVLVCGDCTQAEVVSKALASHKPHLMVTDPPYGVNYDPTWRDHPETLGLTAAATANGAFARHGQGGRRGASGKVTNDNRADWREAWTLFPGDVAYVWHDHLHAGVVQESLRAASFLCRYGIVWNKSVHIIGRGHYHWKHEVCWYAVREKGVSHWGGDRKQSTVWDMEHRRSETGHGTQKPVEAMARPMRNNSAPGDRIYDPFAGSFTSGIAAQMNKRIIHAIEIEPAYVDVGVRRWEAFTGLKAVLDGDGRTFDQIAEARAKTDVV